MRRRFRPIPLATIALAAMVAPSRAQEHHPADPSAINRPFKAPDVAEFVKRFETDAREAFARREAIVRAAGARPGMAVADVGAGTGVFTRLLADRVGAGGTVYAVDIAPAFLKHVAEQAERLGHGSRVKTVLGGQDSTHLPADSVDLVFICDTYHHFEHPAEVLASIRRALRPGGRLVVVDFDKREDSSPFVKGHARAPKEVYFREIAAAGFDRLEVKDAPDLKENFFAAFRRAEPPPRGEKP